MNDIGTGVDLGRNALNRPTFTCGIPALEYQYHRALLPVDLETQKMQLRLQACQRSIVGIVCYLLVEVDPCQNTRSTVLKWVGDNRPGNDPGGSFCGGYLLHSPVHHL